MTSPSTRPKRRPTRGAAAPAATTTPAVPNAHEQLDRLLGSETFQRCDRLNRFLVFIVRETAAGRGDALKEYVIGVQVFQRPESFDPRTDPIVRVQARRLRAKLSRYYREEGRADPTVIDLPKGTYTPTIKRRDDRGMSSRVVTAMLVNRNTIGLLPFVDHSPDKSLGAICSGLREEVVHRLTRVTRLRLLAAGMDDVDAASRGGAALIVGGSVRHFGEGLRVTVQLIDGASRSYLWSESVDGTPGDEFRIQERAADAVVRRLEAAPSEGGAGLRRPTENLAAQSLYLQGRYHLNLRTEEGLRKCVEFFERALAEDANYAPAHSGLADGYALLAHYGVRAPAELWTKATESATTAVMLDDGCAEGHTSLALVKATQRWDWPGAEREFHKAIALNPKYSTAHHWYASTCLAPLGRLDEALEEILIAQSLDPTSSIVARDVANVHYLRRDFDMALEQCDHTIELNPHFAPAYWLLGLVQASRRDFDESLAALQRAVHLSPQTPRMHGALGRTFALAGRTRRALDVLRKLEGYAKERYVSPLEFALIYVALGDLDRGFDWLSKACADRSFDIMFVTVDPRFDPLRGDVRFQSILKQLRLS